MNSDTVQVEHVPDWQAALFAILAIVLMFGAWAWFKGEPFQSVQRFSVRWHDIDGLNLNAAVKVNGVEVGSVSKIDLAGKDNVLVALNIDKSRVAIPANAKFSILSYGLVGAKFIDIALPAPDATGQAAPLLSAKDIAAGADPVRSELVMNKLGRSLEKLDLDEVNTLLIADMRQINSVSGEFRKLSAKLDNVTDHASSVADKYGLLAEDLRHTTQKLDRMLGDPHTTGDLRQAAQSLQATVHELNGTLADKSLRQDLKEDLGSLDECSSHIENSVDTMEKLSNNQPLRTDIKQILTKSDDLVTKVNAMVSNPEMNPAVKGTLSETRDAVQHLDLAARQMNQIMDKKRPLLKLLFGRPGHIRSEQTAADSTPH